MKIINGANKVAATTTNAEPIAAASAGAELLALAERMHNEETQAFEQVTAAEALLFEAKERLAAKREEIARVRLFFMGSPPAGQLVSAVVVEPVRRIGSTGSKAREWCLSQREAFRASDLRKAVPGMTSMYCSTFLAMETRYGRLRRVRRGMYRVTAAKSAAA